VLQCVAVCCSVLQCVAASSINVWYSVLQGIVCCSVLQCVAGARILGVNMYIFLRLSSRLILFIYVCLCVCVCVCVCASVRVRV